jgi:hypothetical protein
MAHVYALAGALHAGSRAAITVLLFATHDAHVAVNASETQGSQVLWQFLACGIGCPLRARVWAELEDLDDGCTYQHYCSVLDEFASMRAEQEKRKPIVLHSGHCTKRMSPACRHISVDQAARTVPPSQLHDIAASQHVL